MRPLSMLMVLGTSLLLACAAHAEDLHPIAAVMKEKVSDPSKPFTMLVRLTAKEGKAKELEDAFKVATVESRKEPGCLAYQLNRDVEKENIYIVYEQWKSINAIDAHVKAPYTVKLLEQIGELTEGGPDIQVLLPIGEPVK